MKLKNKAILALALSMSFVMASNSLAAEPDAGAQAGAQASEPAASAGNNENNTGGVQELTKVMVLKVQMKELA